MKKAALFVTKNAVEFWIFHGKAQKIFKKNLFNEKDWVDFLDSIPPDVPLWLILPKEDLVFERVVVKGLAQLPPKDQAVLGKARQKEMFPRALYAHFVAVENAFFFGAVLNQSFYAFLFQQLEEKMLLGVSSEALFFAKILEKKETCLCFQKESKEVGYEWVIQNNVLIFGRKIKFQESPDFLNEEKEKLRRFLNLPVLNIHVLNESPDFLKEFVLKNASPQISFSPKKAKLNCFIAQYCPFFEKTMILCFLILTFFILFFVKNIQEKNETINGLKEKFNEAVFILGKAEFWENTQKTSPYFLKKLKERDLFWEGKEGGNFEIFLPFAVENADWVGFQTEKKEEGLFISGNVKDVP